MVGKKIRNDLQRINRRRNVNRVPHGFQNPVHPVHPCSSQIRDIETLEIPGVEGHRDFVVQIPEVASTQFITCLEMPIGSALAINAFEKDKDGVRHAVVTLCQCLLRDVEPN
jgi:hypothetical protein